MQEEFTIQTKQQKQVVDITEKIAELIKADTDSKSEKNSLYTLFAHHTTAALSIADLDPGTDEDMLNAFYKMVPTHGRDIEYRHPHDPTHSPDHILAALIGPSISFPVKNGEPKLGQWQRIVLFEFNGPRERLLTLSYH